MAPGRSTVLLNYCRLGPSLIDYVVDMSPCDTAGSSPACACRCTPGGFPWHYPELRDDNGLNYEPEIVRKERAFLEAGGKFIIPLPDVRDRQRPIGGLAQGNGLSKPSLLNLPAR